MAHNLTTRHAGQTRVFVDRGIIGRGLAGYRRLQGYQPSLVPTKVGARHFFPEPDYDKSTDEMVPVAMGNKWDGGKEAYQLRVWEAAKKVGKAQGLDKKQIDGYKPPGMQVGGGMDMSGPGFLVAPGAERPDFTIFDGPDTALADGAAEEIEFDQALSLAGRFGRDFLGIQVSGLLSVLQAEHLTIATADHEMLLRQTLATRTGAFKAGDPELIWEYDLGQSSTAPTTATAQAMGLNMFQTKYAEPFLYVAPRLFYRFLNNLDAAFSIGDLDIRMASISIRLTFRKFIELLERFADVTLL